MHIDETYIYFKTKEYLIKNGWIPLAGEPAGGSDELPRIEIRDPDNRNKGSKGSYKIDLISQKKDAILLTEAKVNYHKSDIIKLNIITTSKLPLLILAIKERLNVDISPKYIVKSLALHKFRLSQIPKDYVCLKIDGTIDVINPELLFKD